MLNIKAVVYGSHQQSKVLQIAKLAFDCDCMGIEPNETQKDIIRRYFPIERMMIDLNRRVDHVLINQLREAGFDQVIHLDDIVYIRDLIQYECGINDEQGERTISEYTITIYPWTSVIYQYLDEMFEAY